MRLYPDLDTRYGLSNNVGYGTEEHINGLKKWGKCQFHRHYDSLDKYTIKYNPVERNQNVQSDEE